MSDYDVSERRRIAREDYEQYKAGKMTKEQLLRGCEFSKWCAAFGDEEAQNKGYGYLLQMQEFGIIKGLRRVD